MKEFRFKWLVLAFAVCLVFGLSSPVSAGQGGNGNGFPSGDHYNLNLIAKKSDPNAEGFFTCPPAEKYQWDYYNNNGGECVVTNGVPNQYCVKCEYADLQTCDVIVSSAQNVIFVPRDGTTDVTGDGKAEDISILIKSGAARTGKRAVLATSLKVTDWCTEHFANAIDGKNDPAVFELPQNTGGYRVYARVTGKPLEGTAWTFMSPSIENVQDEYGNDLYWLGTVGGPDGCSDAKGNVLLDRIETNKKGGGKGVTQATDLSCLFNFTGNVCYVNDLCFYCPATDPCSNATAPLPGVVCCEKSDPITLDDCGVPANYACENTAALECVEWDSSDPPVCVGGWAWVCPEENQVLVDLQCHNYADTWVFDIADFVDVLWQSKTEGAYVVQLRFYKN